ncbi:MAG: zinc-dependent alcohol dehydrogenase [Armatimonadota bacterium]
MKALVKYDRGEGNVKLMDVAIPEIDADEVLIEVKATGVCGSDLHIYHGTYDTTIPLILGHEYAGCITHTGESSGEWRVGDRVVMENNPHACGRCTACRRGSPNICPEKRAIGFRSDGCFADYIKAPVNVLHRIPDDVSYNIAALTEPMAVAVHATYERGTLEQGDFVAVFGPGAIGMMCALVARRMGASKVILIGVDRDAARMEIARSLGIQTINCQADNAWRKAVEGADLIIEASGNPNAINEALNLVSRAGRLVPVGITGRERVDIPWDKVLNKETILAFSYSSTPESWDMALSLLADDNIHAEKLISASLPLIDWTKGFSLTEEGQTGKVLLIP